MIKLVKFSAPAGEAGHAGRQLRRYHVTGRRDLATVARRRYTLRRQRRAEPLVLRSLKPERVRQAPERGRPGRALAGLDVSQGFRVHTGLDRQLLLGQPQPLPVLPYLPTE